MRIETKKSLQTGSNCCRMMSEKGYCPKPLESVSEFLSKKWTISIIITIGNFEKLRFNDILKKLNGPTAKTVTDRLKELVQEEIIERHQYNEIPPRVEYSLTKTGKELMIALTPLIHWAEHRKI